MHAVYVFHFLYFVVSPPVISSPVKDKEVVAMGANAGLSIEAEGMPLTYQWQRMTTHGNIDEATVHEGNCTHALSTLTR